MSVPGIPTGPVYTVTAHGVADPDTHNTWRPFHTIKRYTNAFVWDPTAKKVLLGYKKRGFGKGMYNGFGGKVDPGETVLAAGVRELKEEAGIDAPLEPCGLLFFVGEGESFAHHIAVFRATTYTGTITELRYLHPCSIQPLASFTFPHAYTLNLTSPLALPLNITHLGTQLLTYPRNLPLPHRSDEMRPQWFAFPPLPSSPSHPSSASPPLDNSADEPALPEFPYSQMWKDDPLWFPLLLANTPFVARVDYGPITAGQEIESGMQRWWVATVEEDAFRKAKVWEV